MNRQTSLFVDAARGLAALAVLFTHVEASALVTLADIPAEHRGALAYLAWFFYGFAHQAVVVFFVLSGFLIGGAVLAQAERGRCFFRRYLVDRTIRIYLVLVPALALTIVLDTLGRRWFGAAGVYDLPIYADRSSLGVLAANLLNLQDIFARYFGTDSALWTLSHEYWYYVAFGLVGVGFSSGYQKPLRVAALAGALAVTAIMSLTLSYHLFGFALWLSGACAARISRPIVASRIALATFVLVAVGLRVGLRYSLVEIWWIGGLADAAVAFAFANLLLSLRFDDGEIWRFSLWRGHRFLSEFSFSLYATHLPVVVFLCAAAQDRLGFGWRSAPVAWSRWALMAGVLLAAMAAARLFWRATEANTQALRAFFRGWLSDPPARNYFSRRALQTPPQ
ncbi:MAG: acyltransferase [Hyphomicrobiales bacterium]|nr:acyltransferase [Hyphomicrobiales bacterium]